MKKILNISLVLFMFCLTSVLGGIFTNSSSVQAATTTAQEVTISTAEQLEQYLNDGGFRTNGKTYNRKANDIVYLANDIDMSTLVDPTDANADVITKTFGDEAEPFTGTFDGRGYKISNLRVDVSVDTSDGTTTAPTNQYAGLFGVTNGATIKNVGIAGQLSVTAGECVTAYVGGLVAYTRNTTITNVQMTAKFDYTSTFDCNTNFGSLVGFALDSTISNVICRSSSNLGSWDFSRNDEKISSLGGIVGRLSNTSLTFAVVCQKFNVAVGTDFSGTVDIGGVVGTISQGGSKIINVACENTFSYTNNASSTSGATINIGEIAGSISTPIPNAKNLSYIHFKQNANVARFGNMGNYQYADADVYDNITPSTYELTSLDSVGTPKYFDSTYQLWHPLYSAWDFAGTWYVASREIALQSFYGNFNVGISSSLDTSILKSTSTLQSSYRHGDMVEIEFDFVDIDGTNNDMSKYYALSTISVGNTTVKIVTTADGSYRLDDNNYLNITKNSSGNGFTLTIESVNMSTMGDYNISTEAKKFTAQISTKLFKDETDDSTGKTTEVEQSDVPGFVFYVGGTSQTQFSIDRMTYGQTYSIETKADSSKPNVFVGWYLKKSDETFQQLDKNTTSPSKILSFVFGEDAYIQDSCEIFAKYKDNACVVTFKLDDGVLKLVLNSDEDNAVTENGQTVSIQKSETLKLEIFIKKGYDFDTAEFIKFFDTYKGGESFCTLSEEPYENDEYKHYQFELDIRILKDDFLNSFPVNVNTTKENSNDNTWIWIVAGSVGGALVLAIAIFLIIFFARRNGGGKMGGSGSFKKKNYKNLYY